MTNKKHDKKPNSLIHASSPYLLQHAYNPVEWNEWSSKAQEKSVKENKLMIISVGYAACHWCHVMEHESFEDHEVADWMNGFYVNVKVDREERPDIDAVYMNTAQLTTGRGGWPLNVIALPGGEPVFAGTYFPKDHWVKVLEHFVSLWKTKPEELKDIAAKIKDGLQMMENEHLQHPKGTNELAEDLPVKICDSIIQQIDMKKGGLDKAPKFPMPVIFDYLLNYHYYTKDTLAKQAIHATLINMLEGGIYDQVGGGYARYSVDEYWFVPHFEKMLYDNGQLLSIYSKAYAQTGAKDYLRIVNETIVWLKREMTSSEGLFYSSLDADSEGVEGKFYCFTKKEIENIVTKRPDIFCEYFSIEDEGNWEHSNILYVAKTFLQLEDEFKISVEEIKTIIIEGKKQLLEFRTGRIRPGLDDKCITAWNALTIKGLLNVYQFCDDSDALLLAQNCLDFIRKNHRMENGLYYRNYKNGKISVEGFLDDQAFMVEALTEMYRCTWDELYLLEAKELTENIMIHYYDKKTGSFYYTGNDQEQLVVRTKEIMDNVIASSNSVMSGILYSLGHYFANDEWIELSKNMSGLVSEQAVKFGPYFSNWANTILFHTKSGLEIAVTGEGDMKALYQVPGAVLMKKANAVSQLPLLIDKPVSEGLQIYICKDKTCGLPLNKVSTALTQIMEISGK